MVADEYGIGVKALAYVVCTLAMLAVPYRVLGSPATFEIAEAPNYAEPMDFSVGSEYAYIVYRRLPPDYQYQAVDFRENRDVVLGIYDLSSGAEVSRVNLETLWEEFRFGSAPIPPRVVTVSHSGGVVVQTRPGDGAYLAHVDNGGDVAVRRHYEGVMAVSLDRYRDFTMVHTNKGVMLLDDQLEMEHEWTAAEPYPLLMSAQPSGNDILVLDARRTVVEGVDQYSGTVRWLTLKDRLVERDSISVPITFFYHPLLRILVWPNQLSLFVDDGSQWQHCALRDGESEFACASAAWHSDAQALHELVAWHAVGNILSSGEDGYVVAVPNGCAVSSRRYDLSDAISRYQPYFPSGSSSLGIVRNLIVKEQEGGLFALIASFRTSSWGANSWDGVSHHTVFRPVELSESVPAKTTPEIDGCPGWGSGGYAHAVTAEEVKACVKKGADPNAFGNCGAWTRPLSVAARLADADAVRALLEAGADPNARDENGDTALHDAARYGKAAQKLEALLEGGAGPALRNNAGKLPWDYARENEALRESSVLERLRRDGD